MPTLAPADIGEHWRKHPSDYHADCALSSLIAATQQPDSLQRQNTLREGQVYATLSLRDAVLEATATLRDFHQRKDEHE